MGKTSLALNIATHLAVREQIPVAIFSLEMSREEVTTRLMCTEGKVDSKRLRVGKLSKADWNNLTNASTRLYNAPIFVDDSAGVSPIEIKAKARRLKARLDGHLGLVVVDYLQLMGGHDAGREPRPGDLADLARAQADRPRPRRAGARHLAALARGRAAHRQAPRPVRPARVRARSSRTPTS